MKVIVFQNKNYEVKDIEPHIESFKDLLNAWPEVTMIKSKYMVYYNPNETKNMKSFFNLNICGTFVVTHIDEIDLSIRDISELCFEYFKYELN